VRWYSFQFLLEQLGQDFEAIYHAVNDLLPKLPGVAAQPAANHVQHDSEQQQQQNGQEIRKGRL
jgi:hypothetical protein